MLQPQLVQRHMIVDMNIWMYECMNVWMSIDLSQEWQGVTTSQGIP